MDPLADQRTLIEGVRRAIEAAGEPVRQFETHISWVLVAGQAAYKFKKGVQLPFLDFSTLEARRHFCQEEVRLNRRMAPQLYVDVVAVTGSRMQPVLAGAGEALEYAVRMRAFAQEGLWSFRLAHGLLGLADADALALLLARFHAGAAPLPSGTAWGTPQAIGAGFCSTLDELAALAGAEAGERLSALRAWEARERDRCAARFGQRRAGGYVRECHGDLHCANILTLDGKVQVFDCIEFQEALRWIDVIDDLAFACMDLACRGRPDLAAALLNRYLEATGDYGGLAVLPYYRTHRALVRAKAMLLRARRPHVSAGDRRACEREAASYLDFAGRVCVPGRTAVMITHGYAGCGKTTFARHLVPLLGAIQVRSDVERKRLHAAAGGARPGGAGDGLYGGAATRRTYRQLRSLARGIVEAGWPVIVDAAFLTPAQRAPLRALAASLGVPFFMFDIQADRATMSERIRARQQAAVDASDAGTGVLEQQLRTARPLDDTEPAIVVDAGQGIDPDRVRRACAPVCAALGVAIDAPNRFLDPKVCRAPPTCG